MPDSIRVFWVAEKTATQGWFTGQEDSAALSKQMCQSECLEGLESMLT